MKIINILTKEFNSPNGIAFLFPLVKFKREFFESKIDINFFYDYKDYRLYECNILILDYRAFYTDFKPSFLSFIKILNQKKKNLDKVIFYDNSDSTGTIVDEVFEFVDVYLKNQVLKDKSLYSKKIYGARVYTDFYHKKFKINDKDIIHQKPLNKKDIKKIRVGWNSGLCDYSFSSVYKQLFIKHFKNYNALKLMQFSKSFVKPSLLRKNILSCRIGINYKRNTICFQRKEIRKKLKKLATTNKINRFKYFKELKNSKIVISPFGMGEISLRDFEVFLTGGLLIKPNMDHLETWPNFFQENQTIKCFKWDLSDFTENLEQIMDDFKNFISVSINAQDKYFRYTVGQEAFKLFYTHFKSLIR